MTDHCPTCHDEPLVDLLVADLNEAVRELRQLKALLQVNNVFDYSGDVIVLSLPKDSVEEAIAILEGVVDLTTVNGWVGIASELADVRDLLQFGRPINTQLIA